MVAWRLYACPVCDYKYCNPFKDGKETFSTHLKNHNIIYNKSFLVDPTCPLTGKTIKKSRMVFWDYVTKAKLDPTHMNYNYTVMDVNESNISKLLDKSHIEYLWTHYFKGNMNHKKHFENLLGKINMELYIILLKVYRKEMNIDEYLNSNHSDIEVEEISDITLCNDDCMKIMESMESKSINAIITDLPYGVTKNNWDTPLDLDKMWELFKRIIHDDGIIILTASGKFTARLMMSNIDMFKYDIIWEKTINSGQLNVNKMPLRSHENILIFYNRNRTYNEQKTKGEPYKIKRTDTTGDGYGGQKESEKVNDGFRHARSVIKISNPRKKGGHPTQKPTELMEYLIKTYTNIGDTVLDCCMGCGSTGIAAVKNKRKFIGIELEKKYFDVAQKDIYSQV